MIWIKLKEASYEITSTNIGENKGKHELWVERSNGKTMKIYSSDNRDAVAEVRDMIDFAVEKNIRTVDLTEVV